MTDCQNQNCTITNINKSNRNIAAQFKVIYNLKQSKWKEEDKQRELINNMKYNNMLETNQFLQGVKKSNRLIQLYVDEYSLRDKQVNTNIKEFNKMMGSRSYFNKKTININLNRYMDAKERNEKLKKLHHHEEKPSKSIEQQIRDEIHENYLNQLQKERNTINNCTDNNSEFKGNYDLVTLNYARSAKKKVSKSQEYKEKQYQKFLNRKKEYVNYLREQKKSTLTKMDL